MISINQATAHGICCLRIAKWANKDDHIKLTLLEFPDGSRGFGPWWEFWSSMNEEINGRNPLKNLIVGPMGLGNLDDACWEIYGVYQLKT